MSVGVPPAAGNEDVDVVVDGDLETGDMFKGVMSSVACFEEEEGFMRGLGKVDGFWLCDRL